MPIHELRLQPACSSFNQRSYFSNTLQLSVLLYFRVTLMPSGNPYTSITSNDYAAVLNFNTTKIISITRCWIFVHLHCTSFWSLSQSSLRPYSILATYKFITPYYMTNCHLSPLFCHLRRFHSFGLGVRSKPNRYLDRYSSSLQLQVVCIHT